MKRKTGADDGRWTVNDLALTPASEPRSGATLSPCGRYRYHLWRSIFHCAPATLGPALFVMHNPSTADENADDPTIRRCIRFASDFGSRRLEVVNLYAFRATDPREVMAAHDPVGPSNDEHIAAAAQRVRELLGIVVVGWGAHPWALERWETRPLRTRRWRDVVPRNDEGRPPAPSALCARRRTAGPVDALNARERGGR